eukprot:XP_001701765.1 predicted protein [Chlamydomonas reinhardtii]
MDALVECVKAGSMLHVEAALQKYPGAVNSCETYPLHVAVWRNHLPILERLLAAGANTAAADGESGCGEAALITPWQVSGLGRRQVVAVAAAKHHMLAATSAGELWSWGGNRDGKLGYPNVDTQPTPRNACLTTAGEVWTWGANGDG